jgi:hypothetical protein
VLPLAAWIAASADALPKYTSVTDEFPITAVLLAVPFAL